MSNIFACLFQEMIWLVCYGGARGTADRKLLLICYETSSRRKTSSLTGRVQGKQGEGGEGGGREEEGRDGSWGPGYSGQETPLNLLRDLIEAEDIKLDR